MVVIVNGRIATDTQGAKDFLGITTPTRWKRWRSHVPKIEEDWYSYAALAEFLETLTRREEQAKRSQARKSDDRKTSVVLRSLKGGGKAKGA